MLLARNGTDSVTLPRGLRGRAWRLMGGVAVLALAQPQGCVAHGPPEAGLLESATASFRLDSAGQVLASLHLRGQALTLAPQGTPGLLGTLRLDGRLVPDVPLDISAAERTSVATGLLKGPARRLIARGRGQRESAGLEKTLIVEIDDQLPQLVLIQATYRNGSRRPLALEQVTLHRQRLGGGSAPRGTAAPWSFHGASEVPGQDAILALTPGLSRANRFNVSTATGHGGGIPVVAAWTATRGLALGHLDPDADALALPVDVQADGSAEAALVLEPGRLLQPGESYTTPLTFLAVFTGDYYAALRMYAQALRRTGWEPVRPSAEAYEPSWCSWGHGRALTAARMSTVVPKLQQLGLRWATLDDGWFGTYGDWEPRPGRFSEQALEQLTEEYHRAGLRLTLWWLPLAVEYGQSRADGTRRGVAQVAREHPEWLVLDPQGRPAAGPRHLALLCPALPAVQAYQRELVRRFIGAWGFDGHKLDNVFSVPACYNPSHRHASPYDSQRALGALYRQILEETRRLKPLSVTQICSCATLPNVAWLHLQDQPSVADPSSAAQLRQRIKVFKALLGDEAPVSGDHVELAERLRGEGDRAALGRAFASSLGPGGVPGTRLVWPRTHAGPPHVFLTAAKEALFDSWLGLYRAKGLARGRFRNLYVHGFDTPEGYAVEQAGGRMHYAFFAPDPLLPWQGTLELRGLGAGRFRVVDYVNSRELGAVDGPSARLPVSFHEYLLLEAIAH